MKPFQVMCVLPANFDFAKNARIESMLNVGSEYTVVHKQMTDLGLYYSIAGFDPTDGFDARLFATLPTESEEVAIDAEQEAIIYQR